MEIRALWWAQSFGCWMRKAEQADWHPSHLVLCPYSDAEHFPTSKNHKVRHQHSSELRERSDIPGKRLSSLQFPAGPSQYVERSAIRCSSHESRLKEFSLPE